MAINIDHGTDTITTGASGVTIPIKFSNSDRLLGRSSAGAGASEEITIGTGLSLSGGSLSATGGGGGGETLSPFLLIGA